jgi:signal transduction histidine kinase
MSVPQASTKTRQHSGALDTRLHGRWLLLARVGWVVLAVFTLIVVVASFPVYLAQLQTICIGPYGTVCTYLQLSPEQVEVLKGLGFSPGDYVAYTIALTLAIMVVCLVVSMLIVWRRSDDWMALLVALMLVTIGPIFVTSPAPANSPLQVSNECLYFLALSLLVLVFSLFPTGQFVPSFTRWTAVVSLAVQVPSIFFPHAPFTLSIHALEIGYLVLLGEAAILVAVQLYRYRRVSSPLQRQQTKWVVFGSTLPITVYIGGTVLSLIFPGLNEPSPYQLALNAISTCILLLISLSFGFAMLHYRLWDIDVLINRTLVYGALTTIVVGVYILVVGILGTFLHTSGDIFFSLLATGLVAVLFQPLRARLQRGVNRLTYGERDEPYAVLSRLGKRLEATLAPEAALSMIVETVAQALKLPYAAITLSQGEAFSPAVTFGLPQDRLFTLPLVYHTEIIGQLLLAPRAVGDTFTAADHRLLEDIARQAGVAVHAVRLTADLQRSREQLVTAREEERRRLRRDLHDGLGPNLASLIFKVDAARNLLAQDHERAEALLAAVRQQAQEAITDIRRLVYNLRPPALDELGLLSALREQTTLYQHQGLTVAFDLPKALPTLPAAAEVAAYRIAQEALTNVARHAQAQCCLLRLSLKDDTLSLDISDDGKGLPASHHIGVGLHAMHERASELGGSCVVTRGESGGTLIQVRLPLPREQELTPPPASNENNAGAS